MNKTPVLDDREFEAMLSDHARAMLQYADFVLHNHSAAEDAVQEALVKAWRARGSLKAVESFAPWLRTIVLRECLRLKRRRWFGAPPLSERTAAMGKDTDINIDVARAVDRLNPKLRAVIFLRFYNDITIADVAAELGIPESTAKTRLYEALRRLKTELPAYGELVYQELT